MATDDVYSIPADNNSTIKITSYISIDSDSDKREIEFITTAGVFTENSKQTLTKTAKDTLSINRLKYLSATVYLKSSNIVSSDVKVTAKTFAYPASVNLAFTEAAAKALKISSNIFGMDNSFESEALLTVNVNSETGFPSSGYEIEFLVLNANTNIPFSNPRFREEKLKLNANGLGSAKFTAGNLLLNGSTFKGDLKIIGRLKNNETITDTLKFNIYNPL
ncbi:hypothetical protein PHEL85_0216 [Polaribacter sp. Hel1_85]|nr:hypothetical protein PHEL85_0216 [Polaribacter sp. Hel1_85]